ncbi:MAG: MBL fold metallo-hydrolase [Clostridia bacterium]|nr:MBL fold metallo-hydrolase [Clostridia bacterium]
MNIRYLGHSCFLISGGVKVVTDPFSDIGYKMERVSADFCLISHGHFDHNAASNVSGATVIDGASAQLGKDIFLERIKTFHDDRNGCFRGVNWASAFTLDGVRFCHLGDIGERFSKETADKFKGTEVLFIPVGGNYTIDCKTAKLFTDHISPKIVVPMHYKTPRSKIDISAVDGFKSFYKSIISVNDSFEFDSSTLLNVTKTNVLTFDSSRF